MSFVSELRRRQVFRTAAWYGGVAWIAIEVANTVFPNFGLPQWSVRAVIVGRTDEALRSADRAVQLAPERLDAVNAPQVAMLRAWVLIHSGARADEGYREFERLLGSINLQPRWVAATPLWRLLRDDQRVQQILESRFPGT